MEYFTVTVIEEKAHYITATVVYGFGVALVKESTYCTNIINGSANERLTAETAAKS